MASKKFKFFMFLWKYNFIKKPTLDFMKSIGLSNKFQIIKDLYLNSKFKVRIDNINFYLYNEQYDKSSFDIYLYGIENGWDKTSLRIWKDLSKHSKTIFDIGTNIGLYCLTAEKSNANATVYGFEPSNDSFKKVKKNIDINSSKIKLEKLALSNFQGKAVFYDSNIHTATSSLVLNPNLKNDHLISYEVNVSTFDHYIENNNIKKVDLVSIDVEENEENVLLGMLNILERDKPTILIEVLKAELGEKIQNILDQFNYQYYFIDEAGQLTATNDLKNRPTHLIHSYNVLAIFRDETNLLINSNWTITNGTFSL